MKFRLFDQNANYLPSSFSVPLVKVATVATGVSALVDEAIGHDQFNFVGCSTVDNQSREPGCRWPRAFDLPLLCTQSVRFRCR